MIFKWLLIILLIFMLAIGGTLVWLYSRAAPVGQTAMPRSEGQLAGTPNTTVRIHQSAINDLLAAVFPISGAGQISQKPFTIPYSWTVHAPHIEVLPDGPVFSAKLALRVIGKDIAVDGRGRATVRYDSVAKELFMDLYDIQAHTDAKVLGIPLDRLNIAPTTNRSIRLLRNLPLLAPFKVKKPEDVREHVEFSVAGHRIYYEKEQVIVDFLLKFKKLSEGVEADKPQAQNK